MGWDGEGDDLLFKRDGKVLAHPMLHPFSFLPRRSMDGIERVGEATSQGTRGGEVRWRRKGP